MEGDQFDQKEGATEVRKGKRSRREKAKRSHMWHEFVDGGKFLKLSDLGLAPQGHSSETLLLFILIRVRL